jgi:hypothetical protein
MNTLFAALQTITTKRLQANQALEAAALKANNGLAPTMDNMGRLHAPVNGYVWEDSTYKGGEYLAIEGGKVGMNSKTRIRVSERLAIALKASSFSIKFGSNWTDNKTGATICYAYFTDLTEKEAMTIGYLTSTFIDLTDDEAQELKTSQEQAESVKPVKPMLTRIEQLEQLKTRLSGLLSVSNAAGMLRVGKLLLKVHNRIEGYN